MNTSKQSTSAPIVYLLAIENIAQSPLIHSQVLSLLKTISIQDQSRPIILFSLYPIINWLRQHYQLSLLRDELAKHNVKLCLFPLFYLTRYFYIPRILLPLYVLQAWLTAIWIALNLKPALVHCRSYPAAIVGRWVKKFCGAKLVFDPRSLYPEEGATRIVAGKSVMFTKKDFKKWKQIESQIMMCSDALVAVSQPLGDILTGQYVNMREKLQVIPTTTNTMPFEKVMEWRQCSRKELGFTDDQVIVAYVGSWFDPTYALELFRTFIKMDRNVKWHFLLIVSGIARGSLSDYAANLNQLMPHKFELADIFTVLSLPHADVLKYLASADLAAQPAGMPPQTKRVDLYNLMARSIISIKFTEYFACGLPVFISQHHGAAADIVHEQDLGQVYDAQSLTDMSDWFVRWNIQRDDFRKRAWTYAYENFSIQKVSHQYIKLYCSILDKPIGGN